MNSTGSFDGVVVVRRGGIVDAVDGAAPAAWVGSLLAQAADLDPEEAARLEAALAGAGTTRRVATTWRVACRLEGEPTSFAVVVVDALPMHRALIPLRELILRTMDPFLAQAATSDVELRIDLAEDLPPAVEGDPEKLAWALATLVGNSLRLGAGGRPRRGKPTVELVARVDREARRVELLVRDNGPGMPAHVTRWLFERDPSTGRSAGLALLMVRDVVVAHGGTVDVASGQGDGATFTIRLPLRPLARA